MEFALLYLYSYLVGSIPTAYVLGRLVKGIDIREYGSGNVGASNVFQHVGRWWALFLGAFEVFVKGASPVWLGIVLLDIPVQGPAGSWTINYLLGFDRSSAALAMASLLSIAGHNWSIFLKFQGGRRPWYGGRGASRHGLLPIVDKPSNVPLGSLLFQEISHRHAGSRSVAPVLDYIVGAVIHSSLVLLRNYWTCAAKAADCKREAGAQRAIDI